MSFEVRPGEVVGIIGRNGAGKSTLLKILSRVTKPTAGRVAMLGRVGSLLEVGTGFHPELTGRENVYLNGTLLGLTRREIARTFDAIVDFAGVEPFIDTPVKRYSSGMTVRLGFAVAVHLEPEILIVDEILAVGDAEFRRKSFSAMQHIANSGRTVLFVSHNLSAATNFCTSGLFLSHGSVLAQGPIRDVVRRYLETVHGEANSSEKMISSGNRSGNGSIRIRRFTVADEHGVERPTAQCGQDVVFVFDCASEEDLTARSVDVGFSVHTMGGEILFMIYSSYTGVLFDKISGNTRFRCKVSRLPLPPGRYQVGARVVVGGVESDWPRDGVGHLTVEEADYYGAGHPVSGRSMFLVDGIWDAVPVRV